MKRIGILTAGGDTPALNATIAGAVVRANRLKVEIIGFRSINTDVHKRIRYLETETA